MRCAMTLGCTLPNRLLTGSLIFRIGSQINQACSFMMFWISLSAAFWASTILIAEDLVEKPIDARLFRCVGLLLAW